MWLIWYRRGRVISFQSGYGLTTQANAVTRRRRRRECAVREQENMVHASLISVQVGIPRVIHRRLTQQDGQEGGNGHLQIARARAHSFALAGSRRRPASRSFRPWRTGQGRVPLSLRTLSVLAEATARCGSSVGSVRRKLHNGGPAGRYRLPGKSLSNWHGRSGGNSAAASLLQTEFEIRPRRMVVKRLLASRCPGSTCARFKRGRSRRGRRNRFRPSGRESRF